MKKRASKNESEMRAEYNFSHGVRGKYAARYKRGANVVVLEPDVTDVFTTAEQVNNSLRALAKIIRKQTLAAK
jgi:hypothetical protein